MWGGGASFLFAPGVHALECGCVRVAYGLYAMSKNVCMRVSWSACVHISPRVQWEGCVCVDFLDTKRAPLPGGSHADLPICGSHHGLVQGVSGGGGFRPGRGSWGQICAEDLHLFQAAEIPHLCDGEGACFSPFPLSHIHVLDPLLLGHRAPVSEMLGRFASWSAVTA